jgi:glucokinase
VKARRFLAVDMGGTGIKLGAVEIAEAPRLLGEDVLHGHADRDPESILDHVASKLRKLVLAAGWQEPEGVGIGSAGLIDRRTGSICFSPNLPAWGGAGIGEGLARRLGVPARVDNDVNAFSLAEWWWGAGKRARNAAFLTLGTGIGGAFIVDGRMVRGAQGFAGEPGHATVVLDGTPCPCGNRGCAERYVGTNDIVEAARRHPGFATDPHLAQASPLTSRVVSEAAEQGSVVAREVLAEAGHALGGLLVTLVNIFNPERVVIGGGVALAGTWILDPAREHLNARSLVARFAPPLVLPAGLGPEAGLFGAAALLLEDSASGLR